MKVPMATLAAFAMLAAPPALAQRLLGSFEIEQLVAPIAHYPDHAIQDAIAAHPDLAFTYARQPSEVWRAVLELRHRTTAPLQALIVPQTVIVHHVVPRYMTAPRIHHHHHAAPTHANGPPSLAVQLQQGHKPSVAVQMQRRIPESQRQPIVQQHHRPWGPGANQPHGHRRRAP